MIKMDGVSSSAWSVRRERNGQSPDNGVAAETGDRAIKPGSAVITIAGRRCNGWLAQSRVRGELDRGGDSRRPIQGANGEAKHQHAQRIGSGNLGGDWDLNGLSSSGSQV